MILKDRDILVVPDILANSGGVVVSYLEWVQDRQRYSWDAKEVEAGLDKRMQESFAGVLDSARKNRTTMRAAAMTLAVHRVVDTIQDRGIYP